MRKSILLVSKLLLVPVVWALSTPAQAERYIVKYKQRATFLSANRQLTEQKDFLSNIGLGPLRGGVNFLSHRAEITKAFLNLEMVVVEGDLSDDDLLEIRNNPEVEFIEKDSVVQAPRVIKTDDASNPVATPQTAQLPWGVLAVKAPDAWALGSQGDGVRVMVLDTGVDKDHPAIRDNFEKGHDFVNEGIVTPYDFYDHIGHGTHVAGVILGNEPSRGHMGVAPQARLLMGRVCSLFYECPTSAIIEGLEWAISERVEVLNVSLGNPFPTQGGKEAYAKAVEAGVMIVSASGNYGLRKLTFPAAYESVLAVGAVDENLAHPSFSNWDDKLEVVAPGVGIWSSVPTGKGNISEVVADLGQGMEQVLSSSFDGSLISENKVSAEVVYAELGRSEDFAALDVRGKIVLIKRGTIAFGDKAKNAAAAGAAAAVIFNQEAGLLSDSTLNGSVNIPVVMIEQTVGEALVEKLAQGLAVSMTVANMPSSYMKLDGTSMASPHVAGLAALVRAANPNLTAEEVRSLIVETATPIADDDNRFGKGMVNAAAAVKRALELLPATASNPAP